VFFRSGESMSKAGLLWPTTAPGAGIIQRFDFRAAKARVLPGQAPEGGLCFGVDFGSQHQPTAQPRDVFILRPGSSNGGGNSGVEAAIDLAGIVEHVTLLEFAPEMKADQVLQDKVRSLKNVDIVLNAQTTEVKGDGSKVTGLEYRDRVSGDVHNVALSGIFVQIGLLPNTTWLEGAIERNRMGEIIIDAKCETSVKGVFAAGDCTTVPYKQIIIATGEGAKASLSSFDYLIRTKTA
jgi:alkyl hydroperoxide reductase subunit AhpF